MFPFISICFILFLGFLLFLDWIWQKYIQTRLLPVSDDNGRTTTNCTADDVHLSLEDRVEMYKKTFATNGNQLLLTNGHIVTNMIPGREGKEKNNDIESTTTAIDIELGDDNNGNNSDNANNDVNEDDADVIDQPYYCSGSTTITKSFCLDHTTTADKKRMVNGTCIICFEEFKKDEVIVWSEDANCHHIYHKECMVTYLASNSLRNDTTGSGSSLLNVTSNPCPTCRRHSYCMVRNEDLLPSITRTTATTNQLMAVVDSPLEETVSSSTTVGSNNHSSTNNVTSTTATTATASTTTTTNNNNNNITMINNNETVTASDTSSATVSMTIAPVTTAVNEEIAAGIGLRGVVDDR